MQLIPFLSIGKNTVPCLAPARKSLASTPHMVTVPRNEPELQKQEGYHFPAAWMVHVAKKKESIGRPSCSLHTSVRTNSRNIPLNIMLGSMLYGSSVSSITTNGSRITLGLGCTHQTLAPFQGPNQKFQHPMQSGCARGTVWVEKAAKTKFISAIIWLWVKTLYPQ